MKANELMIGDWVNIYCFPNENPQIEDLFPARIGTIMTPLPSENSGEHIECVFKAKDGGIGCATRPVETCLPIPLTAEILEKNGMKLTDGFFEYRTNNHSISIIFHHCKWSIEIHGLLSTKDEYGRCDLVTFARDWFDNFYVHELQHALRLCGIDKEIVL